jgi:protein SCO1/2
VRPQGGAVLVALVLATVVASATVSVAHPGKEGGRLSKIGPAPAFTLTRADGGRLSLEDLRGHVVAVTFIYARCTDTCPLLTAKMVGLQHRLGSDFGRGVRFVSITVDPERDTPDALRHYARAYGADPAGWAFLTGTAAEIREVARRYAVVVRKTERGDVEHTFLTSIVDQRGVLRVQYMGVRFDPEEFLHDLQSVLRERVRR